MRAQHDGDCSIYASLVNEMYSKELQEKLEVEVSISGNGASELINKIFDK